MASITKSIPLFPLDVVLFPGMMVPLHIFEPRYRKMVMDCITTGEPFGILWSENESPELLGDEPLVGTTALITEVEPLPDGRFNINAVGHERFVVRDLSYGEPYLVGYIEALENTGAESMRAERLMEPLSELLTGYLDLLSRATEQQIVLYPMPDSPMSLAFVTAILYQCSNWQKQELVSIQSIPDLMEREIELLALENVLTRQALERQSAGILPPLVGDSLAMLGLN